MRILLVEDDEKLSFAIATQLRKQEYGVDCCFSGYQVVETVASNVYDLLLLDRMLPEMDGIQIVAGLRKRNITIPILMITAMNGIYDRVDGLDAGADDYLVKPFAMEELLARVRALLRRPVVTVTSNELKFQDLSLDAPQLKITVAGVTKELSKRETDLFEYFMKNPNQVLNREQILTRVWGNETEVENGCIDYYIHFLRRRLKSMNSCVKISAVYGIGYRMEV